MKIKFLCCVLLFSHIYGKQNTPALIPLPDKIEWRAGTFLLTEKTVLISPDDNMLSYVREQIASFSGMKLNWRSMHRIQQVITLRVDTAVDALNGEAYTLNISKKKVEIAGSSKEGLFRGIQTFFQLIPPASKVSKKDRTIKIPCCRIEDKPQFSWRGLNLDCCRHFMTKDFVKRYIDILAYYKYNVLHWHLTDDQGWRIEIKKYPRLTEVGAWRNEESDSVYGGFYTQDDIREIVAYAQRRYITVVPEIEMPGHALASLASYPENSCTGGLFEVTNIWGVHPEIYCAGRDSTFSFLQNVLDEVVRLFPGKYIHIGGDEAPKERWKACPKCQARMKAEGLKDEQELQSYFIKRITAYLHSKGKEVIGWDEILQGGLAPGVIVQSWQSLQGAIEAAKLGHRVICSPTSHTYFDYDPENLDLRVVYSFKPIPDELPPHERTYIVGGEANMWSEWAPQETVDGKLFPRMLALAEVLWNNPCNKNYDEFYARVQRSYEDVAALGIQYGPESKVLNPTIRYDDVAKEFVVTIEPGSKDIVVRYTTGDHRPDTSSSLYHSPLRVKNSLSIKVAAFKNNRPIGKLYAFTFEYHKALNTKFVLANRYDERYRAGGENALVDGIRGTDNFRDGNWQGYEGVDFETTIDLGKEREIASVTPRFYFSSTDWIFLPVKVELSLSNDTTSFSNKVVIPNDMNQKSSAILLKDFKANYENKKARYIKVRAENIKKCPEWHPGAGGPAWLFIDEIVVE